MIAVVKRLGFFLTASLIFMTVMLSGFTVFYYLVERPHNSHIGGWLDAFYFTVITTRTIGFGDISPQTTAGKVGTILNALLPATVFLGASLVLLETMFKKLESSWKDLLMKRHSGHSIIIADTNLLEPIIDEHCASGDDFVVIHPEPVDRLGEAVFAALNDSNYLQTTPTDASLRKARIDRAKRIIIAQGDDSANIFVLVTAKQLNPTITAIVRVNNGENEVKFRSVGADLILPTHRILGRMLSRAAVAPVAHDFLIHLNTRSLDPFLEEETVPDDKAGEKVKQLYPDAVAVYRGGHYLCQLREETLRKGDVVLRLSLAFS